MTKVLAADIGGTKTILAVANVEASRVHILAEKRFRSRDYEDFTTLACEFLSSVSQELPPVLPACFGVAGPVVAGRSRLTKLPWELVETELERDLKLSRASLINDFVAIAYGIEALGREDLETLNPGEPDPHGPAAVLGAGTGLGEAFVLAVDGKRVVVPSEGGHADFAPRDELEIDFLRWMKAKYGRVSYDRVVSGPGLTDIYCFLRDTGRAVESEELHRALEQKADPAPVIHRFAGERNDPLSVATLDFFVSVYGAEAGNLGLKVVATGGVYVAGGIAPRMVDRLKRGGFQKSFVTKGRLSPVVESMPVFVVMNPRVGLLGAALAAARSP